MKLKKILASILALAMVLSTMNFNVFAAESNISGDIIDVDASNAQDVLDGKYGSINGKTINFTEDITEVLDLARPTKYEGSETDYACSNGNSHSDESKTFTDVTEFIAHYGENEWHTTPNYYRTLKNVTFTAEEGVTVAGFTFSAGHVYGECYDYVREKEYTSGSAYYKYSSLEDITFDGLTVTGRFDAKLYQEGSTVKNIVFDGCTFTGTTDDGSDAAIKFLADSQYFTGVTVENCSIDGYFQGVYIAGIDGASVINNNISNTEHNAIALQSCDASNPAKGTVAVEENYITNVSDRAIRLNYVGEADITINNNIMIDCGDDEGQLIKATSVANEATVDLEANYWDGEDASTAVSGITAPTTVGVTGGTWDIDVSDYIADGYELDENGDVVEATPEGTVTPTGTVTPAYTSATTIWGEATGNASESFAIKLYSDNTLLVTATLNDPSNVIIDGNIENVTWNIPLNSAGTDSWWTVEWTNYITATTQPTKVVAVVDGVEVAENTYKLSAPDDLSKVYAAVADADGKFTAYYTDVQEAIVAAAPAGTVEILADVTVEEWVMIAESLTIGNDDLITCVIDGMTINGNGHTLTINSIESAGNGGRMFYDATNLNINDLKIVLNNGTNGIGLQSGTLSNVSFVGGGYGVLPQDGEISITGCTFETNSTAIYYEEARDNLVVTGCTFNQPDDVNVILLRGNTTFTNNTVNSGRTVNVVSGSPVVTGNNFNDVRLKVYNEATATISNNEINVLAFNDESEVMSTFSDNTLSEDAQAVLEEATVIEIYDWEDLKELDARVEGGDMLEGVTVKLMNDIDLYEMGTDSEPVSFNPIGANTAYFKGTFDGQGHTIKNMYQSGWALGYDWDNYGSIGLFAYLWNATVKNLTIENAECFVEGGNVAGIAGCAWGDCTFENITIKNSTYATYNNRAAGIVGYTGGKGTMTFKNITVDEDTVIAALWGSYDCTLGGVVGSTHSNNVTKYVFEDVTVACKLDCYNDVTASYKWYSYRMCGMLIGSMKALQEGTTDVDPRDVVTLTNVDITIGEWANQTYIWDDSFSKGCQRVEPGYAYDGVDVSQYPDAEITTQSFNTIIGGPQSQSKGYYGSDITKLEELEDFDTSTLEVEDLAEIARNSVAQIGDTKYATLQEAIEAADDNGTVEIISDITVDTWNMYDSELLGTVDINGLTINGNNHTLTVGEVYSMGNGGYMFRHENLNINDLTVNLSNAGGLLGSCGGTFKNVTVNGGTYSCTASQTQSATFTNCTFNNPTSGTAIYTNTPEEGVVLTVTGCTFNTTDGYAVILRGVNDVFTNNICDGKVNILSTDAEVTGNVFNSRLKFYSNTSAVEKNQILSTVAYNDGVENVNLSGNYWGTLTEEEIIAKVGEQGVVSSYYLDAEYTDLVKIEEVTNIAKVGNNLYGTFEEAREAATNGETIEVIGDVVFDTDWSFGYYNYNYLIGKDASLKSDNGLRATISYGNKINVEGNITDAKTADKTATKKSMDIVAGLSFNGDGGGTELNVNNAYVSYGQSTSKNSGATGEFNFNFTNSIAEFTNNFVTALSTEEGLTPVFNINVKDSVLTTVSHMELWHAGTNMTVDNSNVTIGGSFANGGTLTVKNGSVMKVTNPIMSSHGGNKGTINVDGATLDLTGGNEAWVSEGAINLTADAKLKLDYFSNTGTITIDAAKLAAGTSVTVIDGTAKSSLTAESITLVNGNDVTVTVTDGDVILTKAETSTAVAKVGDVGYESLDGALDAAKAAGKTEVEVKLLKDVKFSTKVADFAKVTFTGTNREQTIDLNMGSAVDINTELVFNDLTVSRLDSDWLYHYTYIRGGLAYNNCKMIGLFNVTAQNTTFNKCDFYNDDTFGDGNYSIWLYNCYDNIDVNITDCTFDVYERAIKMYGDGYSSAMTLDISGTTFTSRTADKTVVEMAYDNSTGVGVMNLNINNSTATGFGKPEHISGETNAWFNVEGNNTNSTVYVDNVQVWPINNIAKVGDVEYATIQAAVDAAKNGATVTLIADTAEDNVTIADKNITLDLNEKKLTGNVKVEENATVEIKNGTVICEDGQYDTINSFGNLTLTNVNADGERHIVRAKKGSVTINGGTYKYTGSATGTRNVINIGDDADPTNNVATATINSGTFIGPKGTSVDSGAAITVQKGSTIKVYGGTFSNGKNNTLGFQEGATLALYGGTYDQDPTAYVADGYEVNTNTDGTYSVVESETTELFRIAGTSTSLESSLALNIFLALSDLTSENYYAVVEHEKATGVVKTIIPYADWVMSEDKNYKVIRYTGVAAKEMADKLTITVYNTDGTQASEAFETSLKDYALSVMTRYVANNNTNNPWLPALTDMLNYGAAAQKMFNYKTGSLASAGAEDFQKYASTEYTYTLNKDGCYLSSAVAGTSLTLEDMISLNIHFNEVTEGMYAKYSYTTHAGTQIDETVDYASFENIYGYKTVPVGIAVADAETLVTVTLYNSDDTEAGTAVFSVNAYLKDMIDSGDDAELYPALAKFAASAKAAFAK